MNKPKSRHEKKTKKIEVLLTETQYLAVAERAKQFTMSNSEFGLFCMLNSDIKVIIGAQDNLVLQLNQLNEMFNRGILKEHEFSAAKQKLLKHTGDNHE